MGYLVKKIIAGLGSLKIDYNLKDCGTKRYYSILLTNKNSKSFSLRNIVEGGKIILLDDTTILNYIGKDIQLRSPLYCIGENICATCAGELYRKLGTEYFGILSTKIGSTILQRSLKRTHDLSIKTTQVEIDNSFSPIEIE
jgi:hypothetical protein